MRTRAGCALTVAALVALLAAMVAGGLAAEEPLRVVQASEILGKIERGESVDYDRVFIEGDLDIGGLDLPTREVDRDYSLPMDLISTLIGVSERCKVISTSIKIANSVINGSIYLNNTIFKEEVSFESTEIRVNADFGGSSFSDYANFREARTHSDACFVLASFGDDADFWLSGFDGDANFWGSSFGGNANFGLARFGGDAGFGWSTFGGDSDFGFASFGGDAYFEGSTFLGPLDLSGSRFDRFEMEWSSLKGGLIADGPAYLALIKSLKELGRYEDADSCYYQYRRWRQDGPEPLWSKVTDTVAWLSCGYGVRPSFTLAWCFGLMGIFALLFWLGGGIQLTAAWDHERATPAAWSLARVPAVIIWWLKLPFIFVKMLLSWIWAQVKRAWRIGIKGALLSVPRAALAAWRHPIETQISFTEALYFSILVFVSQPPPHWMPRGRWRYAVMAEDVLGWLMLALLIVTLGNVMIR